MRSRIIGALAVALSLAALPAIAEDEIRLPSEDWSFSGLFGHYDMAALKRGYQVYHDVCSNCHAMKQLAYRNLAEIGFSDAEIAKFAAEKQVTDGPNDAGDMFQRPGKPSDHFVPPFPNDQASRAANGGALPPDLSLIVKAREGGPNYVFGILTGFMFDDKGNETVPAGFKVTPGMHYNKVFPGHQIAMPPPLQDGTVTFADGTKATLDQEAHDVVTFLTWASNPELDMRHNLGIKVLIFGIILTVVAYALKRKIWADVH